MARYRHIQYGRRNRTGRRVLPLLFCLMLGMAGILVFGEILPTLSDSVLVIRDSDGAETHMPAEDQSADQSSDQSADPSAEPSADPYDKLTESILYPDTVITGTWEELSGRTSFRLEAETGNDPVETLASMKAETAPPEELPPRVIGQLERIPASYDYASPVPESEALTREYFSDAVLLGDSRMQGLILYCGLSRVTSYTYKGLTVDSVFTRPIIEWEEAENLPDEEKIPEELWEDGKVPVMEALRQTDYNKVYIMLGINETGWPDLSFFPKAYGKVIDAIREDNPQCLIYILSVFPVTEAVSEYHDFVTNDKIALYNQYLQQLAYEKQVFFVDLAPAVVNEDGVLPADSGVDGIHLNKTYCTKVLDHILSHTVPLLTEEEVLAAERETAESTTEETEET